MRDGTVSGGAQGRELRARRGDLLMARRRSAGAAGEEARARCCASCTAAPGGGAGERARRLHGPLGTDGGVAHGECGPFVYAYVPVETVR
jgi:hypothetical protein